ncbi:MAG: cardiolipin synthase [Planctomycetota bacterium]|jgi:cardiolipin synthase
MSHRRPNAIPAEDATAPLFALATRLTGLAPSVGNRVRHLAEDERAFELIESSIREAERTVLAEYDLVRNDSTGRRFLELLADKAAQGVDVRLLYDAVGSLGLDSARLLSPLL